MTRMVVTDKSRGNDLHCRWRPGFDSEPSGRCAGGRRAGLRLAAAWLVRVRLGVSHRADSATGPAAAVGDSDRRTVQVPQGPGTGCSPAAGAWSGLAQRRPACPPALVTELAHLSAPPAARDPGTASGGRTGPRAHRVAD